LSFFVVLAILAGLICLARSPASVLVIGGALAGTFG
jgi:hypothetical protein